MLKTLSKCKGYSTTKQKAVLTCFHITPVVLESRDVKTVKPKQWISPQFPQAVTWCLLIELRCQVSAQGPAAE
jgi:hypothetical protein